VIDTYLLEALEKSRRYASHDGITWHKAFPWTSVDAGEYCVDYTGEPVHFAEDMKWAYGREVTLA
jgi:hypothetical protein